MLSANSSAPAPGDSFRDGTMVSLAALVLVTVGAAIPLVMMVDGSINHGIEYARWTWPAIPAAWVPAALGAVLLSRRVATGAMLLVVGSALGVAFFWQEWAVLTFAPAWVLGAWAYLDAGRRRGWL